SFGLATGAVQLVIHCVDPASPAPSAPFTNWTTAAAQIQDAIDAAHDGEFVLVTNGVYSVGGRVMAGDLTNRVVVPKAATLCSLNGRGVTTIQGAWDPVTTNGPLAVRALWLGGGATACGFRIVGGATRNTGNTTLMQTGGGIWCAGSNCFVLDCDIIGNGAAADGGGGYLGAFNRCRILSNTSVSGGGVYLAAVANSLIQSNVAQSGGGVSACALSNCTVVGNVGLNNFFSAGSGMNSTIARNSIIYNNTGAPNWGGFGIQTSTNCCTIPAIVGTGNMTNDPQVLDGFHLAITSPCRGAGNPLFVSGVDLDGEPWTNPPSMGCDEVWEAALTGPLSVTASAPWASIAAGGTLPVTGTVAGKASRVAWDFGDGSALTNASYVSTSHFYTNSGDYTVTFTAFNIDNPGGVSTNLTVHVVPFVVPSLAAGGFVGLGTFSLTFTGQPGITYVTETATNLTPPVSWIPLSTVTSPSGLVQVTDSKATNQAQFYRIRTQ
ncbi:MAG TPA: PKD domain-containing protein, partial [Candidatus Dormibacteraeota bacterium]|nr:PKD domain-containing protein [Candidatus Dormibacteraeota bacterium]